MAEKNREVHDEGAQELRRGWGIVFASLLGISFGIASYPLYSLGSFFAPLQAEFGWTRQDLSTVPLILTVGVVVLSYPLGLAADRLGPARLIIASQLGLGCSFAALGVLTRGLLSYYLLNLLMAVLSVGTLATTFNKIIAANFAARRGLALGIALAGTGVGGFVAPNLATWLIGAYGWREAYIGLAVPPLLLALPAAWVFLRTAPVEPDAGAGAHARADGVGVAAALRSYRFYAMGIAFFIGSGAVTGFVANLVPLLRDKGYPAALAATVAGTFGIAVVFGRVLVGWCLDRFWGPAVALAFLLVSATGAFALAFGTYPPAPTILFAGMIGMATGAEFDMCAYFTARYFGLRNFGRIYGAQYITFALGGGLAAPAYGRVRDLTGSYDGALIAAGAVFVLAGVLLLSLGRYPAWPAAGDVHTRV
jgi:MFS family permease